MEHLLRLFCHRLQTAFLTEHTGWGSNTGWEEKREASAGIPSFLYKQAAGLIQGNPGKSSHAALGLCIYRTWQVRGGRALACAYVHAYELIGQAYRRLLLIVSDSCAFRLIVVKIIPKYSIPRGNVNNSTVKSQCLTGEKKKMPTT